MGFCFGNRSCNVQFTLVQRYPRIALKVALKGDPAVNGLIHVSHSRHHRMPVGTRERVMFVAAFKYRVFQECIYRAQYQVMRMESQRFTQLMLLVDLLVKSSLYHYRF